MSLVEIDPFILYPQNISSWSVIQGSEPYNDHQVTNFNLLAGQHNYQLTQMF